MPDDVVDKLTAASEPPVEDKEDSAPETGKDDAPATANESDKPDKARKQTDVPVAALTQERERWQTKYKELEAKFARYDQIESRLQQFYEERKKEQEASAAPKYEDDPAAYFRHQQEQLAKRTEELAKRQEAQEQHTQRDAQVRALTTQIRAAETQFVAEKQDYYDALKVVRDRELQRLKMFGLDDAQALQALEAGEIQTAAWLLQNGRNPAQYVYELAGFYGYQSAGGKQKDAEKELDQLENKMKAAGSLGSGSPPKVDDIVNRPQTEFDAVLKEMFGR